MKIGSLFAGIGGLELGLERAGFGPVAFQVEIDPFCRRVLARHWPEARRFNDVCAVGAGNLPSADVICGGFPCQDVSVAGKGAGLAGKRSGLWFEFARIIAEMQPKAVVIENVAALRSRGLAVVRARLRDLGYRVAVCPVSAADLGAPHRRERLFIVGWRVADASGERREPEVAVGASGPERRRRSLVRPGVGAGGGVDGREASARTGFREPTASESAGNLADAGRPRLERHGSAVGVRAQEPVPAAGRVAGGVADPDGERRDARRRDRGERAGRAESRDGDPATQSGLGRNFAGISAGLDLAGPAGIGRHVADVRARFAGSWPSGPAETQAEWEPPRTVATRGEHHSARLKALGNAVVPACAEAVGLYLRELLAWEFSDADRARLGVAGHRAIPGADGKCLCGAKARLRFGRWEHER